MILEGIECKPVPVKGARERKPKQLYAKIPLDWVKNLPGESAKAKLIAILWCYSGMEQSEWFSCRNKICERYGISQSQKTRILKSLEASGHIKLRNSPGKTVQVKLVKPPGWK